MSVAHAVATDSNPALKRLAALTDLDAEAASALDAAARRSRTIRARREVIAEGAICDEALLILAGWAARVRVLEDGRRQILDFLLPGDFVGLGEHRGALVTSAVTAMTDLQVCVAPSADDHPSLHRAYAISRALSEVDLLAQITRLGRLNAHERIADLLLELHERLELAGLAVDGRFNLPLTQELLADALGLTSVHVNRTLQTLRRDGTLSWKGREIILSNPRALSRSVGRGSVRAAITKQA